MKKTALSLIFIIMFITFTNLEAFPFEKSLGSTNIPNSMSDLGFDIVKGSDQYNGLAYIDAQNRLKAVEGLQVLNLQFQAMFALMVGRAATAGEVAAVSESRAVVAEGKVAGGGKGAVEAVKTTTRVGRWMSKTEYEQMVSTGKVQMSPNGNTSYVANPADSNAFKSAPRGSMYVEFDVPTNSIYKAGNENWGQIAGPSSLMDRFNQARGLPPITEVPNATNIKLVEVK